MFTVIEQIVEEAETLGRDNRQRDHSKGIVKTASESASATALEMFFDGAEDENTPENRARVHLAYVAGYVRGIES